MYPFVTEAYAQSAGGAGDSGGALVQFLPFILIFVIFYFLLIRPQQKQRKQHQQLLEALKIGDKVVTTGGIYASVVKLGDDRVTLEIAPKVNVQIDRIQIARLSDEGTRKAEKEQEKAESKQEEKSGGFLGFGKK
ncbi:MAG: preprotein translocase subunit YajC [SAR324 cluster bacterium]|nr:preprotein translocase subunit YajC [SAR324 cluster bacterium]